MALPTPPGTYLPPGATVPIVDDGGYYSGPGATAETQDLAGTYSSPYALNRMFLEWNQTTPANVALRFNSVIAAEDYYGTTSHEGAMARQFFAQKQYGYGYANAGATMYFQRYGFGQRPHLLGANVANLGDNLPALQAVNGPISITFDGYLYSGHVNLAGVASFADASAIIAGAFNHPATGGLPVEATTTNSTITPQSISFQGYVTPGQTSHLYVTNGVALTPGGIVSGKGINPGAEVIGPIGMPVNGVQEYNLFSAKGGKTTGGTTPTGNANTIKALTNSGRISAAASTMMGETYGLLQVGTVTTGALKVGQEIKSSVPLSALSANLGGGMWVVDQTQTMSGEVDTTAPPLTVFDSELVGPTENHDWFNIQPNGFFGFNENPSNISFATGLAAEELGLAADSPVDPVTGIGAIDSSPGGLHPTFASWFNSILKSGLDQFHNPVHFGSFQGQEPRFLTSESLWEQNNITLGIQLLSQFIDTTMPAGQPTAITDPTGTWSPAGATHPFLGTPPAHPSAIGPHY
jgi:hypothetical protein